MPGPSLKPISASIVMVVSAAKVKWPIWSEYLPSPLEIAYCGLSGVRLNQPAPAKMASAETGAEVRGRARSG